MEDTVFVTRQAWGGLQVIGLDRGISPIYYDTYVYFYRKLRINDGALKVGNMPGRKFVRNSLDGNWRVRIEPIELTQDDVSAGDWYVVNIDKMDKFSWDFLLNGSLYNIDKAVEHDKIVFNQSKNIKSGIVTPIHSCIALTRLSWTGKMIIRPHLDEFGVPKYMVNVKNRLVKFRGERNFLESVQFPISAYPDKLKIEAGVYEISNCKLLEFDKLSDEWIATPNDLEAEDWVELSLRWSARKADLRDWWYYSVEGLPREERMFNCNM